MSNTLSGQNLGVFPYNLDGLQNIDVTSINGQQLDFSNLVQYSGNTDNLDMGPYNIKTAHTAAGANDVVNLLSLTSRLSSLTGYILGINGLNYVPYSGGTADTILGTYGLSAGNVTANSSLSVGGLSVLNGNVTAISNLNVNGLTTLNRGQTNFTAVSSLDITNKAYVDTSVATAIANISVGSSILATNNIFTGTNEFNNNITAGFGFTTDLNGVIQTKLNSLGFTSASFTTSGITGTYSPPLGTITNVSGATYQIAQTNQGRAIMAISGFAPSVLTTYIFQINIKCTVGTAILSVEQDNILRSPQYYQLSTSFNTITGKFYYDGNPSTIIFNIYTGIKAWNAQWDSFTLSTYSANIVGVPLYAPKITTANSIALTTAGGALTMASSGRIQHASFDNSYTLYGPSASYPGFSLAVGATPDVGSASIAQLIVTNGNVFLDASNGKSIYYGSYQTDRGGQGIHTFYGNVYTANNLNVSSGSVGIGTAGTPTHKLQVVGDVSANGLIVNGGGSFVPGCILSDANWGMLFRAKIVGAAGAFSFHNSAGTERMRITDAGIITMGATATQTTIGADGVIKWVNPNGTQSHWGYPSGGGSDNYIRGTNTIVDTPLTLNNGTYVLNSLAYNTYIYAHSVVLEGATLRRSQCLMRQVYNVGYISWGGGINMTYAFYKYSQVCPVRISGKYSGYCTFVGMPTMTMRIYSQNSGVYRYYPFPTYQNITYAQTTYPIDIILDHLILPEVGWFDIYIYNSYGMSTDINNQLWVNVQLLPVNSF